MISERIRDGRAMAGCVELSDGGRVIGGAKKEGKNSYGGVGICSMVSFPSSRWVRKPVE